MNNKQLTIANIEEVVEQLQETLSELRNDAEYSEADLKIDFEHVYHHLNYAWHIRNASEGELDANSQEDFVKWSKYPIGEILEYE